MRSKHFFVALILLGLVSILYLALDDSTKLLRVFDAPRTINVNYPEDLTEEEEIGKIADALPSLPARFLFKHREDMRNFNGSCSPLPSLLDLNFVHWYWQTLVTSNGTFKLVGAYLDDRALNPQPFIRILGMVNRRDPNVTTHCQVWYEEEKRPFFAEVSEYSYMWWKYWGVQGNETFQPYLISCPLPKISGNFTPIAVSLVEKACDKANNVLTVFYNKPEAKKGFAVCTKGLTFLYMDVSVRLTEWIEILFILGIDKIFIYDQVLHPNVKNLLAYYSDLGKVEVMNISMAQGAPNHPNLKEYFLKKKNYPQYESLPYTDCFLRHMYEYKYIALFDIDEFIMPLQTTNYHDLFAEVVPKAKLAMNANVSTYFGNNVYFLDGQTKELYSNIPAYHHILQHTMRSRNFTANGHYIKGFHDTERVLTLHNHFPFACIGGSCVSYGMEKTDAQLNHYRKDCVGDLKSVCTKGFRENPLNDTAILRFREQLVEQVRNVLNHF